MKRFKLIYGILILLAIQVVLSSCSPSSTTATKPGAWDRIGDFEGITRSGAVRFVLNNVAYVGTGYNYGSDKRLVDFWRYDAPNDSWKKVADFPGAARTNATSFTINGKAYVGTGYDGTNPLSDFYEYDPSVGDLGSWKPVASFGVSATNTTPLVRYGAIGFSVGSGAGERGFVGSGTDITQTGYKDFWEYNQATDEWISRPSIGGSKRWNAFVMVIDNYAYVGGGQDGGIYPVDFWKFDVSKLDGATSPWTQLDGLDQRDINGNAETEPKSRESAVTFTINGFGYIAAGLIGYAQGDTWQYNPTTDDWIEYYSLNTEAQSRSTAVGFGIGNFGFITTGANGNTRLDDVWKFDPSGTEPNYK